MGHKEERFNSFKEVASYLREEQNPARILQKILARYGMNVSLERADKLRPYFEEGNTPEERIQKTLYNYGINITLAEANNIELIEVSDHHIKYLDKKKKELNCSDYIGGVSKKWDYNSQFAVKFAKSNIDETFFVEYYHNVSGSSLVGKRHTKEMGQRIIEERQNPDSLLFARAYADVVTKYGQFCLCVEDKKTEYEFGPHFSLQLFYGNHNNSKNFGNDFDFEKYCLFRWNFMNVDNFSQWWMGYKNEHFGKPIRNIYNYGITTLNKEKVNIPIYAFENHLDQDYGLVLIDGRLKCKENENCGAALFWFERAFDEYEEHEYSSKAYFVIQDEDIAILKKENTITVEAKVYKDSKYLKVFSKSVVSDVSGQFTYEDFQMVLSIVDTMPLKEKTKITLKDEINAYLNIHSKDNIAVLNPEFTLENRNFEDVVNFLKSQDLIKFVEELLESASKNFCMEMDELLGENPPNQTKPIELKKKQES